MAISTKKIIQNNKEIYSYNYNRTSLKIFIMETLNFNKKLKKNYPPPFYYKKIY